MKSNKNVQMILYIGVFIIIGILGFLYVSQENSLYPNKEFNKVFVPNTKIYKQIQEYTDQMLYNYSGIDRVHIFNFHNGTEDIREIPFLKESIQIKSLRDERFDITESFKEYPIPHDLFKINYLYENGFLSIDSSSNMIPKSMKSQLLRHGIKNVIYNILIGNDGIPFGYISMENVNSKNFKFSKIDSISFSKDVAEIEIMFDKLLRERKESFSETYIMMYLLGFTGIVIVFIFIGFSLFTNKSNDKLDQFIEFIKPKFDVITDSFSMLSTDIKTINNKVVFLEDDRKIQVNKTKSKIDVIITALEETGDKIDSFNDRLIKLEGTK